MKLGTKKAEAARSAYAWYSAGDITWVRALLLAGGLSAVLAGIHFSSAGRWVRATLARPAQFLVRHKLKRNPHVDPRLRILTFDDRTARTVRNAEIPAGEWAKVLQTIAGAKPRAVVFETDPGTDWDLAGIAEVGRLVRALQFPIVVPGKVGPPAPFAAVKLPVDKEEYLARLMLKAGKYLKPDDLETLAKIPVLPVSLLGSDAAAGGAWTAVGQLQYDDSLEVTALARLNSETMIPYLPFFTGRMRGIADGKFQLDGKEVPISPEGRLVPNFMPPAALVPVTEPLETTLQAARAGNAAATIPADSIVLIVPLARTESSPTVRSPFGPVPRAHVAAAVVNSILVGKWIAAPSWGWALIVAAAVLGMLVAVPLGNIASALAGLVLSLAIAAGGLWIFSVRGFELPWIEATLTCLGTVLAIRASKRRTGSYRTARLHHGLDGLVAPADLARIEAMSVPFTPHPATSEVTLMAVEIVGLSLCADRQEADKVFSDVRMLLQRLAAKIHAHNGVISRLNEHGALCWFGYRHGISESARHHADLALSCAIAIQKECAERSLVAHQVDEPVYPFRIGLQTSSVHAGDLAVRGNVELAAVGMGAQLAVELASASEPFCVTVGATTKDRLTTFGDANQTLKKKLVRARYGGEVMEAYEHDPFWDNPQRRNDAIVAQRDFAKIDRIEMRWAVPPGSIVQVTGSRGAGFLVNFSRSGIAVKFDHYLARGVSLSLTIHVEDPALRDQLTAEGLMPVGGEIQWARTAGAGRYLFGLVITTLSEAQKDKLLAILRAAIVDRQIPRVANG